MSSSLSVYLLDVTATRALVGSHDDELLTVIRERFGDDLAHADDYFADEIEGGAPTAFESLKAVVHGGPFSDDKDHAFQYGYAYKRLCALTGSSLDSTSFSPHRDAWLSTVDEGLRALGITAVSVEAFARSNLSEPLPWTYTPGSDAWTSQQCAQALEEFEIAKQAIDATGHAPPLEPETAEAILQCLGWMRHAAAQPGFGIIGFRT